MLMTQLERVKNIVKVLNESSEPLSARQIAEKKWNITSYNDSHVLSTGQILNVMNALGLVKRFTVFKGKSPRYKFQRKGNNLITVGN